MEELVLDSGVRKIAIKNEDGDVITVLSINVADADTAEKEHAQDEVDSDNVDVESVLQANRIRVKYLKQIAAEIDGLFGEDTVKNVYGDFTPDETALVEFVEKIIPVMNKLFGKRYEMTRKRYNSGRKGARV